MKESNNLINDFYDVAGLFDDDLVVVSMVLQCFKKTEKIDDALTLCNSIKPSKNVIRCLEDHRLVKYEHEIEAILDLRISHIRMMNMILRHKSLEYRIQELVKLVNKNTTLIDFMEE